MTSLPVPAIRSRATGARHRHRRNRKICKIKLSQVETLALNAGWHARATTRKPDAICFGNAFDLLFFAK